MAPSRRRYLSVFGAAGSAGLAGCAFFWDTHDDSSLALHFEPVAASDLGASFLYTSDEWTPSQRRLVAAGVPNGTATYGHRPFGPGEFVAANGTYYAVSVAENGTGRVVRPTLRAEPASDPGSDAAVGDSSGLESEDENALKCAVASADETEPGPCVLHAGNASAFWPDPAFEYVELGGEYYRLVSSERNVTLVRYDYAFEPVARNRSAFATFAARELLAVDYDSMELTAKQRDILQTATREGVYRESPPPYSEALRDLVEAFRRGASYRRDYVRFEDDYYLAWIMQSHDD